MPSLTVKKVLQFFQWKKASYGLASFLLFCFVFGVEWWFPLALEAVVGGVLEDVLGAVVVRGVRRAVVGAAAVAVLDPALTTVKSTLPTVAEEARVATALHAATRALHIGRHTSLSLAQLLLADLCAEEDALGEPLGLAHLGRLEGDGGRLEVRLCHDLLLLVLGCQARLQDLDALLLLLPSLLAHLLDDFGGHLSR
jgi:hypothetical protein